MFKKNKKQRPVQLTRAAGPAPSTKVPAVVHQPSTAGKSVTTAAAVLTHYPKADILLSAGPRKGQKDTELGEDVAGISLAHDQIVFWVLDGTSDSPIILTDKGVEIFSSRVLALTLGAALHQLARQHHTTDNLLAAAFDVVKNQLSEQIIRQRDSLQQFLVTQHQELKHWQVSTTLLLGILSADGTANLLRIGDSKAFCYSEEGELIENAISAKPDISGLGRLYARIAYEPSNEVEPFTFTLMPPLRDEQKHEECLTGVRRIIAFSDGIGQPTEQYMQLMLKRQTFGQFQAGLGKTPNRTFDDKTIVLASFEPS